MQVCGAPLGWSAVRGTSWTLIRLILVQQCKDETEQLTSGEHEGATMFEAHGFAILALIKGVILGGVETDAIRPLNEIVAKIAIAGFGHAAGFTLTFAGFDARPPQTRKLG